MTAANSFHFQLIMYFSSLWNGTNAHHKFSEPKLMSSKTSSPKPKGIQLLMILYANLQTEGLEPENICLFKKKKIWLKQLIIHQYCFRFILFFCQSANHFSLDWVILRKSKVTVLCEYCSDIEGLTVGALTKWSHNYTIQISDKLSSVVWIYCLGSRPLNLLTLPDGSSCTVTSNSGFSVEIKN